MVLILTNVHQDHDIEHSKDFNHRLIILSNANAGDPATFKLYNSKSSFMKKYFIIMFWKAL